MSKAEDLSKQYREFREKCGIKDPVMLDEIEEAYFEGYNKAEKDLELDWKDIKLIIDIVDSENLKPHLFDEIDYQEVLKRFKESKER